MTKPEAHGELRRRAPGAASRREPAARDADEALPTFSEQVASQVGGVRGTVEAGVPVLVFVVVNIFWALNPALIAAVAIALGIAGYRYYRKQSVRYALNGILGVAVGAIIAWRTGDAKDFYLPTIWTNLAYGVGLLGSVFIGKPAAGWLWSVVADKGGNRWFRDEGLRRTFGWLTLIWSAVFLAKFAAYLWVYYGSLSDDAKNATLGAMKIALGAPPYILLLALTVWAVRRHQRGVQAPPLPA